MQVCTYLQERVGSSPRKTKYTVPGALPVNNRQDKTRRNAIPRTFSTQGARPHEHVVRQNATPPPTSDIRGTCNFSGLQDTKIQVDDEMRGGKMSTFEIIPAEAVMRRLLLFYPRGSPPSLSTIRFPTYLVSSFEGLRARWSRRSILFQERARTKQQSILKNRAQGKEGQQPVGMKFMTPLALPHLPTKESCCTAATGPACFRRPQEPRNSLALQLGFERGVCEARRKGERATSQRSLAKGVAWGDLIQSGGGTWRGSPVVLFMATRHTHVVQEAQGANRTEPRLVRGLLCQRAVYGCMFPCVLNANQRRSTSDSLQTRPQGGVTVHDVPYVRKMGIVL